MLKLAKIVVPTCVVLIAIAASYAGKGQGENLAADADCKQCNVACSECEAGAVAKAMDALPKLVYRIGDETTTSPVQAGRISRKNGHKVEFVVAKEVFKEEPKAFAALVELTEKFVGDFAKPQTCDASGSTLVAGQSFCCEVAAGEVSSLVKKAMDDVKITYQVGKQSVCCPDAAAALAKKSGQKVVQLVAGKACGGCSTTTRFNLARAKYKAAVEALLAANNEEADNAKVTTATDTESKLSEGSTS